MTFEKVCDAYPTVLHALSQWQDNEVRWLPLRGKVRNMVVLVDPATAGVINILDIDPWPSAK